MIQKRDQITKKYTYNHVSTIKLMKPCGTSSPSSTASIHFNKVKITLNTLGASDPL